MPVACRSVAGGNHRNAELIRTPTRHDAIVGGECAGDRVEAGSVSRVSRRRTCSRSTCERLATATLTYVYSDQTAVLGPLSTYAEPHAYDLCDPHAERLSGPRGWEVIRLSRDTAAAGPTVDDLLALADAVREAGRPKEIEEPLGHAVEIGRRGHLRMLRSTDA